MQTSAPRTRAETSRFTETSLHRDVMAFVAALDSANDPRLVVTTIGTSPGGRALPLLVLSSAGVATPAAARALGRPIVLIMSGIHAGEVEGKEACLMLVRDLLAGAHGDVLAALTLVVVPLFNPDGNDATDPANRALHLPKLRGQLGPAAVGTRNTSADINLNRDYLRCEAAEMRLWQARVWQAWAPDLTIDNHATNGSVHRFAMTYDVPHTIASAAPGPILYMRDRLTPAVRAAVRQRHGFDSGWYGNFAEDERVLDLNGEADPSGSVAEGWMTYPHQPRFGANYRGLCGRMDLLLEAYAYIPFAERVGVAYAWMLETLHYVALHADEVRQTVAAAVTPPARIAVRARLELAPEPVTILTRTPRVLDGAPTSVTLPYFGRFVGTTVVERPAAYFVPPRLADALRMHGLAVEPATGAAEVEVPTVEALAQAGGDGRAILEAAGAGELRVAWRHETRAVPAGWGRVATDQPHGAVAVYLCEPESDDSAIDNGFVDPPVLGAEIPIWRTREERAALARERA